MKILFVNSGIKVLQPSLGLGYLSSYIQRELGLDWTQIRIADENTCQNPLTIAQQWKPEVIGITATTTQFVYVSSLVKRLRAACPNALILMGGAHITTLPESLPAEVDLGVIGEGELTLCEILRRRQAGENTFSDVAGVVLHGQDGRPHITASRDFIGDVDSLPLPARHLFDMDYYVSRKQTIRGVFARSTQIMSSRGCPFDCSYCGNMAIWKRKTRFFSAAYLMEEMRHLHERYAITAIFMQDDLFSAHRRRLREFVELKNREPWSRQIVYSAQIRANVADEETMALLKESGCIQVEFGFESGSDRVLKALKGSTANVSDNLRAAELARRHQMRVLGTFVFGSPEETWDDVQQTLAFIRNAPLDMANCFLLTPYPGTRLWTEQVLPKLSGNKVDWSKFNWSQFDMSHPDRNNILVAKHLTREQINEAISQSSNLLRTKNRIVSSRSGWQAMPEFLVKRVFGDNWEQFIPYRLAFSYKKWMSKYFGQ